MRLVIHGSGAMGRRMDSSSHHPGVVQSEVQCRATTVTPSDLVLSAMPYLLKLYNCQKCSYLLGMSMLKESRGGGGRQFKYNTALQMFSNISLPCEAAQGFIFCGLLRSWSRAVHCIYFLGKIPQQYNNLFLQEFSLHLSESLET